MDFTNVPDILKNASMEVPRQIDLKTMGQLLQISYDLLEHPILKGWNGYEPIEPFIDAMSSQEYYKLFNKTIIERTITQSLFYSKVNLKRGIVTMTSKGIELSIIHVEEFFSIANKLYNSNDQELHHFQTGIHLFRLQKAGHLTAAIKYFLSTCNEMILIVLKDFIQDHLIAIAKDDEKIKYLLKQMTTIKQQQNQFDKKVYNEVLNFIQLELDYYKELNALLSTSSSAFNLEKDKFSTIKNVIMPKNFEIEKRETFEKPYLKVYLKSGLDYSKVADHLTSLHSVRKVNITDQKSGKKDLTIYPAKAYDISEVEQEIELTLKNYFEGNSVDPSFITETISSISDIAYFQIVDYIILLGKNLESFQELNTKFDEERYRDYFLPFLNAISKQHSAKGEVFNKRGKTDILVFDQDGNNIFIAECKLWKGEVYLLEAVQQLLENYVNWRDEKTAIIIFNRDNKKFSNVIDIATKAISNHKLCLKTIGKRNDTSYSYSFRHVDDSNRTIKLELVLLNFSS